MFVSAYHDKYRRGGDVVQVWERQGDKRVLITYPAPYYFYHRDPSGTFEALTGEKLSRIDCRSRDEFESELTRYDVRFESDLNPLEKVLMDNYLGKPVPTLVLGLFDIEVDYTPKLGFPRPHNPYAPISAITLYRSDLKEYLTLAVPPRGHDGVIDLGDSYILFTNEREMLEFFLTLIEDVDVLSGWNSEFFDLPYLGKRIELLFGQSALRLLAFPNGATPRWGEHERFKGSQEKEIILILDSRVHLDYLRLFRKFNLEGRQSFSLAAIADDELKIPKLAYEGSLYDLYRNDFVHFLKYNRRDVEILVQLNKKFKYIELANRMVHEATVNFHAVFGSVQLIDTAIMNFCHSQFNKILFDKKHREKTSDVEGALVMSPKIGMHRWVGACDINSLYPNTYRSLNLSPEKVVGQLTEHEMGWRAVYDHAQNPGNDLLADRELNFVLDSAPSEGLTISVVKLVEMLKKERWSLSAHGTILDQSSGEGLIPAVLSNWFKGRKEMQAQKKKFAAQASKLLAENGGNEDDPSFVEAKTQEEYYDMLQGVRKVLLNSSYGATLNQFCRFFDQRLGSSTTDSGRQITTHMINVVSKNLLGENYPKVIKKIEHDKEGKAINTYTVDIPPRLGPIYGDTDSVYFTMDGLVDNLDDAIACADAVAAEINVEFKEFMQTTFFCQPEFDDLIKANREIVAASSIFRAKKKYILLVADKEGTRIPLGHKDEMKTMGSDIKLSSTPEAIREFLKTVTLKVLRGEDRDEINEFILQFRRDFKGISYLADSLSILDFATVTSVKELDKYYVQWERIEKPGLGRVSMSAGARAVINHNECLKHFNDQDTQPIIAGQKVKMIWLMPNEHGYTNIAFSSETDITPEWFNLNFQPDLTATEEKLIDAKLRAIFEPIGWTVPTPQTVKVGKLMGF